jgi:S-DNA-T family DNA segregation ATPase FtsK/SpoIIIE
MIDVIKKALKGMDIEESVITDLSNAFETAVESTATQLVEETKANELEQAKVIEEAVEKATVALKEELQIVKDEAEKFVEEAVSEKVAEKISILEEEAEAFKLSIEESNKVEVAKLVEEAKKKEMKEATDEVEDLDLDDEKEKAKKKKEKSEDEDDKEIEESVEATDEVVDVEETDEVVEESIIQSGLIEEMTSLRTDLFLAKACNGLTSVQEESVLAKFEGKELSYIEEHIDSVIDEVIEESVYKRSTHKNLVIEESTLEEFESTTIEESVGTTQMSQAVELFQNC